MGLLLLVQIWPELYCIFYTIYYGPGCNDKQIVCILLIENDEYLAQLE